MPGDMTEKATLDKMSEAYVKGAERLQSEGVDTDGYIITEVLNDVDLVRKSLGYSKINLFSASYGTRLAMIYDWMFPNTVHRSAMISVNPPGRFEWRPEVMDQHLKHYSELYKKDSIYGNPDIDIAEIIRKYSRNIPKSWMFIPIKKGYVLMSTFMMLYSTDTAPKLFDAWIAASNGDWSGIAMLSLSMDFMLKDALLWGDLISKASSADYDFDPDLDLMKEFMPENSIIGAPGTLLGIGAVDWPSKLIPDSLRTVQYSETNTLLINGNIDVSTPEQFGRKELLPYLKNGTQVLISEAAHTSDIFGKQRPALDFMLTKFYKTGIVDNSKYKYQAMSFKVGLSFQAMLKLSLALIVLVIVLIAILIRYLVIRRQRRTTRSKNNANLIV
jgi:pimeloyl-ACP methyl ester carboxylesterase